jgi:hypothetical protein
MKLGKKKLAKKELYPIGSVCFLLNGIILFVYALAVPTYVRSVHGLITLTAVLFGVAALPLYYSLRGLHEVGSKVAVFLMEVAVVIFIIADVVLTLGLITPVNHAFVYVAGNILFIIGVLISGVIMLKGVFYKWVAYLSIVTGLVGLATNIPPPSGALIRGALFLLAAWFIAMGYNMRKLAK